MLVLSSSSSHCLLPPYRHDTATGLCISHNIIPHCCIGIVCTWLFLKSLQWYSLKVPLVMYTNLHPLFAFSFSFIQLNNLYYQQHIHQTNLHTPLLPTHLDNVSIIITQLTSLFHFNRFLSTSDSVFSNCYSSNKLAHPSSSNCRYIHTTSSDCPIEHEHSSSCNKCSLWSCDHVS